MCVCVCVYIVALETIVYYILCKDYYNCFKSMLFVSNFKFNICMHILPVYDILRKLPVAYTSSLPCHVFMDGKLEGRKRETIPVTHLQSMMGQDWIFQSPPLSLVIYGSEDYRSNGKFFPHPRVTTFIK